MDIFAIGRLWWRSLLPFRVLRRHQNSIIPLWLELRITKISFSFLKFISFLAISHLRCHLFHKDNIFLFFFHYQLSNQNRLEFIYKFLLDWYKGIRSFNLGTRSFRLVKEKIVYQDRLDLVNDLSTNHLDWVQGYKIIFHECIVNLISSYFCYSRSWILDLWTFFLFQNCCTDHRYIWRNHF